MKKELISGEYAWVWDIDPATKQKRIWLGCFNGRHLTVIEKSEMHFSMRMGYDTITWLNAEPIEDEPEEPVYYYRWKKILNDEYVIISNPMTDEYAMENCNTEEYGWTRIESSKTTFEEIQ